MPDPEDPEVWKDFKENPDGAFLDTVSSKVSPTGTQAVALNHLHMNAEAPGTGGAEYQVILSNSL